MYVLLQLVFVLFNICEGTDISSSLSVAVANVVVSLRIDSLASAVTPPPYKTGFSKKPIYERFNTEFNKRRSRVEAAQNSVMK